MHAARDFASAIVFGFLTWMLWHAAWAWLFLAILAFEIDITLQEFIEEGISRRLPADERAMHAVMAIIHGAFPASLLPQLLQLINRVGWSAIANGGLGESALGTNALTNAL